MRMMKKRKLRNDDLPDGKKAPSNLRGSNGALKHDITIG
jgi:hypothetical protein